MPTKNQRLKFALRSVNFELKCYIEKKLPREEKMKHSLAFALSLMLVSGTALAGDRLIGADVEKALEQSSAQMNKSVEK